MMKKRIVICFFILLSVPVYLAAQNPVVFFEEHIEFILDDSIFSINGIYSFCNNSKELVTKRIIFPFAVKTESIDSIRVINLNREQLVPYRLLGNAISFNLTILPKDTLDINIFYRQKTSIKNTYILTTTQAWGRPLEKATYTLITPKKMPELSFSYPPDSMQIIDNNYLYRWKKVRFLPKYDFNIVINGMK